jgi:hypothetical protein
MDAVRWKTTLEESEGCRIQEQHITRVRGQRLEQYADDLHRARGGVNWCGMQQFSRSSPLETAHHWKLVGRVFNFQFDLLKEIPAFPRILRNPEFLVDLERVRGL